MADMLSKEPKLINIFLDGIKNDLVKLELSPQTPKQPERVWMPYEAHLIFGNVTLKWEKGGFNFLFSRP